MRVIILSLTALCLATSVSAAPGAVEGPAAPPPHHHHVPKGADAICKDGTYGFAGHHDAKNCVGHGGVRQWW